MAVFQIQYTTHFGQSVALLELDETLQIKFIHALKYKKQSLWKGEVFIKEAEPFRYRYRIIGSNGEIEKEDPVQCRRLTKQMSAFSELLIVDEWPLFHPSEYVFQSKAMKMLLKNKSNNTENLKIKENHLHINVWCRPLKQGLKVAILGSSRKLGQWNIHEPVILRQEGNWWRTTLLIEEEILQSFFKYVVFDSSEQKVIEFEIGDDRQLDDEIDSEQVIILRHYPMFTEHVWKGSGINIQLSALRSDKSWGVGDFGDLKLWTNWAADTGFRLIQLLPINDTTAYSDERDSYPYAPISSFALHPIYLDVSELSDSISKFNLSKYLSKAKALNQIKTLDYRAVLELKFEVVRGVFEQDNLEFLMSAPYQSFFRKNRHWLKPYASFCVLRDQFGSANYFQWPDAYRESTEKIIRKLTSAKSKYFRKIAFYYFLQFHLDRQLKEAVDHAHHLGVVLKGDLPIGVGRHSVDTWMQPHLFHIDQQAGAPPDAFTKKGQNWGFPTYNWEAMKLDGYAWWKNRFKHMEQYMDAIRIDHILGFFRIWSIPIHAMDGLLGHFIPAMPITELSLRKRGIQSSMDRLKKPLLNPQKCHDLFGKHAEELADLFFDHTFRFKEAYNTQKSILHYLKQHPDMEFCKQFLFDTMTDVILWEEDQQPGNFHFRIDMMETDSFQTLDHDEQEKLKRAYYDYFYQDQNECWRNSANEKLSAIRKTTNLMICAEDLGMVPDMVEEVLQSNEMLALQIQRMPKRSGQDFAHPKDAPYLSVVMPSTHDMSPLRAWWLEPTTDHVKFWENQLQQSGKIPEEMDEHLARKIIHSHLSSPAMWSVFLLQDLFAISATTAKPNPKSERINDPADPAHFWNYRTHISIEQLQKKSDFKKNIQTMLMESGR